MSDNPFSAQTPDPSPYAPPKAGAVAVPPSAPGALTTILVFCLIFGIFGLIGTCIGGGSLAAMGFLEEMVEATPVPEEQKVFNRLNFAAQKGVMLPAIILMGINLIVATMLIIGSIGCFKRKESSRGLLRTALLAAIIYSVLKIVVTLYTTFTADSALKTAIENLKGDPMYQDIMAQYSTNQMLTMGGAVFGVVIALVILGFYVWARSYLNKDAVIEHFAAVEKYKRST